MRRSIVRATLTALAVAAATVLVTAGAANAEATTAGQTRDWFTLSSSKLTLSPHAEGGYRGVATIKVTYIGNNSEGVDTPDLHIAPPAGLQWLFLDESVANCGMEGHLYCMLSGHFDPGQTRTYQVGFEAFAGPRSFARIATGGWMRVDYQGHESGPFSTVKVNGVLASDTGSVKNPKPYVQSTVFDMSLTGSDITVTRAEDGSWLASIDLTARYKTDAANWGAILRYELPGGAAFPETTDPGIMCLGDGCYLNEYHLYEGSVSSLKFTWKLDAGTAPGVYHGAIRVLANDNTGIEPVDATPTDNIVALTVTIP